MGYKLLLYSEVIVRFTHKLSFAALIHKLPLRSQVIALRATSIYIQLSTFN